MNCPAQLEQTLEKISGLPVQVTITDNTRSMISFRRERRPVRLRLHRMFLEADPQTLHCLADYIRTGRLATQIRQYIQTHSHMIIPMEKKSRTIRIVHQGEWYNLKHMYDRTNARYFNNELTCLISWGRRSRNRNKRSIRFGSYVQRDNLIRIHPLLDRPEVPQFFVEYIVYHEMLHAVIPRSAGNIHSREYRNREKEFPYYRQAREWEKKNIRLFIR